MDRATLAEFLRSVAEDPWYPLWCLIALRGRRRGEAAGLRWCDLDLEHRQLAVVWPGGSTGMCSPGRTCVRITRTR